MMKNSKINSLVTELSNRNYDIKVESVIYHAVENGFSLTDFIVFLNSFFEREFSKDIVDVALVKDDWERQFIEFKLSRPSLYDMLPEGLFFQPNPKDYSKGALDVAEMALQYRKDKTIEKDIRKFFQPFEQEFIYEQVLIESEETSLLKQFDKPIPDIWDFPETLNTHLSHSLLLLLPYAHQIAGNIVLMENALQLILGEKVKIEKKTATQTDVIDETIRLGDSDLGATLVCGNVFWEDFLILEYIIGPLKKYTLLDFLNSGKGKVFIDTFNRFFAPLEADIQITIEFDKLHHRILLETDQEPILGHSTIL